jgi:hypothetical protein
MDLARHNLAMLEAWRPRTQKDRTRRAVNIAQCKAWIVDNEQEAA